MHTCSLHSLRQRAYCEALHMAALMFQPASLLVRRPSSGGTQRQRSAAGSRPCPVECKEHCFSVLRTDCSRTAGTVAHHEQGLVIITRLATCKGYERCQRYMTQTLCMLKPTQPEPQSNLNCMSPAPGVHHGPPPAIWYVPRIMHRGQPPFVQSQPSDSV